MPAPALDGIGSLRSENWFYEYFSVAGPAVHLAEPVEGGIPHAVAGGPAGGATGGSLAKYMASLKVKDWYLESARAPPNMKS